MVSVLFLPANRFSKVDRGTTILAAARQVGVLIEAPCNGAGHCGKCAVQVETGDLACLSIPVDRRRTTGQGDDGTVLACHAEVHADLVVRIPERQETGLQIVAGGATRAVARKPAISKRFAAESGETLVRAGELLIGREQGDTTADLHGVVVDIGTTTLAVGLVDLNSGREVAARSALNPQSLHAQDVLSRIRFAADRGGLETLRSSLITELDRLLGKVSREAGIARDSIYEVVFSGNTCMLHLAFGVDPAPLGRLPFTPGFRGGDHRPAADHGLRIAPGGLIWLPPVISAYVGADITAGMVAAELASLPGSTLFIDIGTNGEMVLATDGRLAATATAAGPAFEGMNIRCGMRAAAGAIEQVTITPAGEVEFAVIGGSEAVGLCGSGLMDLVAELVRTGVVNSSGRFCEQAAEQLPASLGTRLGKEQGKAVFRVTGRVALSQGDVRQVQLAKGAIRAGIDLLLAARSIGAAAIDRVFIAGSFGFHLREESLLTLGLLPPEVAGKVSFLGNTAKSGGALLLLNRDLRDQLAALVPKVDVVELAADPQFDRAFMAAMKF
jgi:uncharacterized 2Fe-2S/4Fe-4S cluster protein (DUF4445 family)